MQIKLMTFNIQHCNNYKTGEIDFSLFVGALSAFGADIVGLNEVRGKGASEDYADQTAILAEGAGYPYHYFAKAIDFGGVNPYGNAILSRYPIISADTIPIPDPIPHGYNGYYETRCAARAVVDVGDGEGLTVLAAHFGLNPDERENARDTILANLEPKRCVAMGDFNSTPDDPIIAPIFRQMTDAATAFDGEKLSFPSDKPEMKIDYVFVTPDIKVVEADVPAAVISDHRPHTATLEL